MACVRRAKTSIILLRRPSRFNRSQLIEPSRSNLRRRPGLSLRICRPPPLPSRRPSRPPSPDRIISSCLPRRQQQQQQLSLTLFRVMTSLARPDGVSRANRFGRLGLPARTDCRIALLLLICCQEVPSIDVKTRRQLSPHSVTVA